MARIFLCHSSANNAEAIALREWMVEQGWDDLFLDLDPHRGFVAGERWEAALREAAGRCQSVIFVISRAWLNSQWCRDEFNLARHLNKRLFGVLVEDIPVADLPESMTLKWPLIDLTGGPRTKTFTVVVPPDQASITVAFAEDGLARLKIGLQETVPIRPRYFASAGKALSAFLAFVARPLSGSRLPIAGSLLALAVMSIVGAALLYILALLALNELEETPWKTVPGNAAGARWITAGADGGAQIREGNNLVATAAGHAAPLASAEIISSGTAAVTASIDGSVRLTKLPSIEMLQALTAAPLLSAFEKRVWSPYGAPFARRALSLIIQIVPLHVPETRKGRRGRTFKDCPECPVMMEIEPGIAFVGAPRTEWARHQDEGPRHLVAIRTPFAIGRFEVTFAEWDACADAGGCAHIPQDGGWGRGNRPVIDVSWADAKQYAKWLSERTGKPYRLPTEAEWEYAARAGKTSQYSWGSEIGTANANCYGCGSQWDGKQTAPVGSFKPNAFGLYDMHGNVWEWVEDCYANTYQSVPRDGTAHAREKCGRRIIRGGCWDCTKEDLRAAARDRYSPTHRFSRAGFRLARTLAP